MSASIRWQGVDAVLRRMKEYERAVIFAVKEVAKYWSKVFETYAKENAPWTDRAPNARQSLHGWAEELAKDTVRIYLSHGVQYGIYLETRWQGRWGIIWPTIQAHLNEIKKMLQGIFGKRK